MEEEVKETCLNCNHEVEEDQLYCEYCGIELPQISEEDKILNILNQASEKGEVSEMWGHKVRKKKIPVKTIPYIKVPPTWSNKQIDDFVEKMKSDPAFLLTRKDDNVEFSEIEIPSQTYGEESSFNES